MEELDWWVQDDAFMANTPHGAKPFTNLIATLNVKACKRLVISCHYDSKYSRNGRFVGATDSAVPCAMMIAMAKSLDLYLKKQRQNKPNDVTLQFMFFDGEEAFEQWTNEDS